MLSRALSLGLVLLSGLTLTTRSASAHNSAKYTNVPFVVAGSCPQYNTTDSGTFTARFVNVNGATILQLTTNSSAWAGFEVYCSNPSSGTLPNTATGSFPEGTLTFNFSSATSITFPSGGCFAYYSDNPTTGINLNPVVSGNSVSIPINNPGTPGANVVAIQIYPTPTSGNPTINLSNFRYNNAPLLFDTTVTDQSETGINYCEGGP